MAYTEEEAKRLVIEAGLKLVESGLIARTWGNISARISEDEFVITPSGMAYDTLTPDTIVKVKIADCSYEGNIKPSSEKGVHAEAYRLRPDVNFVIHTHQLLATSLSVTGENIKGYDDEYKAVLGDYVANAEYGISSTKGLKKKVSACIENNPASMAILMRNHGTVCLGRDFDHAFDIAFSLEKVSYMKIAFELAKAGFPVSDEDKAAFNNDALIHELIASYLTKYTQGDKALAAQLIEAAMVESPLKTDVYTEDEILTAVKSRSGYTSIVYDGTPVVKAVALTGKTFKPLIDDMAQISGASVRCVSLEEGGLANVASVLKNRSAFTLKGMGVLCCAYDDDESSAISMVLDKDLTAELYASLKSYSKRLSFIDCFLQRTIYVKKYSKLKKQN